MANLSNPAVASLLDQARTAASAAHDDALDAAFAKTEAEEHLRKLPGQINAARSWAASADAAVAVGMPGAADQADEARRAVATLESQLETAERACAAAVARHASAAAAHLAAQNAAVAAQRHAYDGYRDPLEDASW